MSDNIGFASSSPSSSKTSAQRKKKKPKSTPPELVQTIKEVLPGELGVAIPIALEALGVKGFYKTHSIEDSPFGQVIVPFLTHTVEVPGSSRGSSGGREVLEIPWGRWVVPGLGEVEAKQDYYHPETAKLVCYQGEKEDEALWKSLIETISLIVPTLTLFKGRAFQVKEKEDLIVPRYIDLTKQVNLEVNEDVMEEIDLNIFSILRHREELKRAGVRMKRGVVLEGHYGSGKTLLAYLTAQAANEYGQTFIMVNAGNALRGYKVALNRQPSVLFVEDMDSGTTGNRDNLNGLLNTLSGVETKGDIELLLLVSTNFIDRIDPAFLRPERLGAIIQMHLPNEGTIGRILKGCLSGSLARCKREEWDALCTSLIGATPAIVAEVAERGKIHAVRSGEKVPVERLQALVAKMQRQRELAIPVYKGESLPETLARSLHEVIGY